MRDLNVKFSTIKHVANKILMIRRAHDLTQEAFAERVNIEARTISRAESGKHRQAFETLEKICIAFQVPMSYFFDNSIYEYNQDKNQIINEILSKLKVMNTKSLKRISSIINSLDF